MKASDLLLLAGGVAAIGLAARQQGSRSEHPTSSPAFLRWFGASKVVDDSGRPRVVYHGTNAHAYSPGERIEVFNTRSRGGAFFSSDPRLARQYGERVYPVYLRIENPLIVHAAGRVWSDIRGDLRIEGDVTPTVRKYLIAQQQKRKREVDELLLELQGFDFGFGPQVGVDHRRRVEASDSDLSGRVLADLLHIETKDSLETDNIAKAARGMGFDGVIFSSVKDSPTGGAGYSSVLSNVYVAFNPTQIKSVDNRGTFSSSDPRISYNLVY
jgi:hypothetical protein